MRWKCQQRQRSLINPIIFSFCAEIGPFAPPHLAHWVHGYLNISPVLTLRIRGTNKWTTTKHLRSSETKFAPYLKT
jgi:hypothetical protein